jgi:hypothetical protein
LYLGCIFAPLLLFFAVSGIWQLVGIQSPVFRKLSSIHTQARWKDGSELGSFPLRLFVLIMAVSFIITTILGVMMAFKFGRSRKAALWCVTVGIIIPVALVFIRLFR